MKIPPMFIRSVEGTLPENVVLRDRYNNLWQVKVEQAGNCWYFKDGWTEFVSDNIIKSYDMLLYEYFAEGFFDFKILGSNACEKKGVGGPKYNNIEEQDKLLESENDGMDDADDEDYTPTTIEENEQDDCPRRGRAMKGETSTSARGHKRKRNCDWVGEDIFRSGVIPQPKNPYFVTTRRRNRETELYIPMDVVNYYNIQFPEAMILIDPSERRYRVKRHIWKDGRTFYVGGWRILCSKNSVEIDDKCICEFVQEEDGSLCLRVSFFRADGQQI